MLAARGVHRHGAQRVRELPERIVVPLGRVVGARWSPADAQRVYSIAVPGASIGLTEDEFAIWSAASAGVSRATLVSSSPVEGPVTTYDIVARYGLLAEIATEPAPLLREATALRLLAHTPVGIDPVRGTAVVGDPDGDVRVLSPVVHEVYCWSAATHSLAAAVVLVASRASEAGLNDPEVIRPERLARRVLVEAFPLVRAGLVSFGFAMEAS